MKKILLIGCLCAGMALASCGGNSEQSTGDSAVLDTATMESADTLDARGPGVDPAAGHVELDTTKKDTTVTP